MRMAELARLSGVSRETIHYYLRAGLLPKPTKGGKTVSYYDELHLERLKLIRKLRDEKYLPLAVIRQMIDVAPEPPHASDVETLADVLRIDPTLGREVETDAVDEEAVRVAMQLGLLGRRDSAPSRTDPTQARVMAAVREALDLEGEARQLTLDDMAACARELSNLVDTEASLFFDLLIDSGDVVRAIDSLRAGRGAVARFITAFRDLMLRAIVDEILEAVAAGSKRGIRPAYIALSPKQCDQLGVPERRDELWDRARSGDAAAANDLVWHLFVVGPAKDLSRLSAKIQELLRPRARLLVAAASLRGSHAAIPKAGTLEAIAARAGPFPLGEVLLAEATLGRLAAKGPEAGGFLAEIVPILHRVSRARPEQDADPLASASAFYRRGQLGLALPRILGRHAAALADLERALEVVLAAPGRIHPAARARLEGNTRLVIGQAHADAGKFELSREHLERARSVDPAGPLGHAAEATLERLGDLTSV